MMEGFRLSIAQQHFHRCDLMCTYYYPSMWYSTAHSGSPQDALHLLYFVTLQQCSMCMYLSGVQFIRTTITQKTVLLKYCVNILHDVFYPELQTGVLFHWLQLRFWMEAP